MELATESRPRFRTDLVAECIDAEGQRFIDVIDPDTGDAFRFYEVEYSLACAMDGERDVPGLVQWAREELGIEPSRAELETVITTLGDLGYLAGAVPEVAPVTLGRGVVAPAMAPPTSRGEVELGFAGGAAPVSHTPIEPDDVELGVAGGTPAPRLSMPVDDVELGMPGLGSHAPIEPIASLRRGATRPDADEDGPTHLPAAAPQDFDDEVSVDLSEHLSLRPDDVKEAVRMSRSMKAVEVPPELLDEIGQKEAESAKRAEASRLAARDQMDAMEPAVIESARPMMRPDPAPELAMPAPSLPSPYDDASSRPPVELPEKPVVVSRRQPGGDRTPVVPMPVVTPPPVIARDVPPVAQKRGVSGVLIFVFVLVILGAGAYAVWTYVLNKPDDSDSTSSTSKEPKKPPKPPGPGTGTASAAGTGAGTASGTAAGSGTASGTAAASSSGSGTGKASASGTGAASSGSGASSSSSAGTGTASASGTGAASASSGTSASSGSGAASGTGAGTASGSAEAPAPSATLEGGGGEVNVTADNGGSVMTIAAAGSTVAEGDVVAEFTGGAAIKAALARSGLAYDVETRYPHEIKDAQAKLDAATAAKNAAAAKAAKAKIDERTKRLDEQKKKLDTIEAQLAALTVTAPAAGKIVAPVKKGANVAAGAVVAKIDTGGGGLTATFDLTGQAQNWAVGVAAPLTVKGKPDQRLKCSVAAVNGAKLTVSCPTDGGASAGTAVLLQ